MSRSTCNRADLVRVLAAQSSLVPAAAELLGYSRTTSVQLDEGIDRPSEAALAESVLTPGTSDVPAAGGEWPEAQTPLRFWLAHRFDQREPPPDEPPAEGGELTWRARPDEPPVWHPMAEWPSLVPRLRRDLTHVSRGLRVDVEQVVRRLAEGRVVHDVPRQTIRRWGDRLQVIVDRSERLIPYGPDQAWFLQNLKRLVPRTAIQLAVYDEARGSLRLITRNRPTRPYAFPDPGVCILVLGDLGVLGTAGCTRAWLEWTAGLLERGGRALAVVPCSPDRVPRVFRSAIQVIPWQKLALARSCTDEALRCELVDQMFRRLAPAKRIEPGLLRAVRRVIPRAGDASLESDFWQDARLDSTHRRAASPHHERMPDFRRLSPEDRRQALGIIREWRQPLGAEVWISEIWGLDGESESILPASDREDAARWQATLASRDSDECDDALIAWLARATAGTPQHALQRQKHLRDLHRRVHRHNELLGGDPQELQPGDVVELAVGQVGQSLAICAKANYACADARWHSLGSMRTRTNSVLLVPMNPRDSFWKSGRAPAWANDWGQDEWGAWVELAIERPDVLESEEGEEFLTEDAQRMEAEQPSAVTQRMRWIPPGRFLMGSPESEEGHWDDEGPQREVTLTHGFWMFDTPVTQELWQAVMGDNPSHFRRDRRPVENVSWDDAQRFLDRLNDRMGEAAFVLPSEAQWEYACRAGTTTAYSFGDDTARLEDHAWYGPNSNDTTHEAAQKQPNRWGLFDMHGNVLEWCQDYWAGHYREAATVDPTGPSRGHDRVLRGGGWYNDGAQLVRSAYRVDLEPGVRSNDVGFRCAQVQAGAEPAEEDGAAAEPQAVPTQAGEAVSLRVDSQQTAQTPIPAGRVVIVRSDVDSLELRKTPKPDWASAIGRDRYGLWAEFAVNVGQTDQQWQDNRVWSRFRRLWRASSGTDEPQNTIVQRMRWIPPGRFWMGSPEGDEMAIDREKPQHEVTLSHGYWLFDTPVTQELWLALMGENPSRFQAPLRPVEGVSWDDCQEFLRRINDMVVGLDLSLPTEAEWEYACRAGTITRYAFGEEISPDQANYRSDAETAETSEVGSFPANPWGLFDLHGNVWEWCQDWYGEYAAGPQLNPQGARDGRSRVLRGGCWLSDARLVRSAFRDVVEPGVRDDLVGFRCARVHPASRERERTSEGTG